MNNVKFLHLICKRRLQLEVQVTVLLYGNKKKYQGMIQNAVLSGHAGDVLGLVLYKSGDQIISGGVDKQLKRTVDNKWKYTQYKPYHEMRMIYIKLTQQEHQLLAISDDKVIKILKLIEQESQWLCSTQQIMTINQCQEVVYG